MHINYDTSKDGERRWGDRTLTNFYVRGGRRHDPVLTLDTHSINGHLFPLTYDLCSTDVLGSQELPLTYFYLYNGRGTL